MATKTWKGYLKFSLVSIPVYLNIGARDDSGTGLNMLHKNDKGKICGNVKMPRVCGVCDKKLEPSEIVKGYKTADDSYVVISPEELEAIEPESSRIMEIKCCVAAKEVDPLYLAESFYLLPEDPGLQAYSLLVKALADTGHVAIAQLCKNNREHVVLLRPKGNGLIAHYLWYADEVNRNPEFESLKPPALAANEMKLAKQLVESMAEPFNIGQFKDGFRDRFNTLIASKLDKTVKAPLPIKTSAPATMDMLAALEASLKRKRAVDLVDGGPDDAPAVAKPKRKKSA